MSRRRITAEAASILESTCLNLCSLQTNARDTMVNGTTGSGTLSYEVNSVDPTEQQKKHIIKMKCFVWK